MALVLMGIQNQVTKSSTEFSDHGSRVRLEFCICNIKREFQLQWFLAHTRNHLSDDVVIFFWFLFLLKPCSK